MQKIKQNSALRHKVPARHPPPLFLYEDYTPAYGSSWSFHVHI